MYRIISACLAATVLLVFSVRPGFAESEIQFEVCYDFGCRSHSEIRLQPREWRSVAELFNAKNAVEERKQIKLAVAKMERLAGVYSPVHRDLAMNLPLQDTTRRSELFPGQLDCIDESINTTRFLALFERHGLLRFHTVLERAYRRSFITQHWAAQVVDTGSGKRYVIDSWFEENGAPPVLVSSERWHDLSL